MVVAICLSALFSTTINVTEWQKRSCVINSNVAGSRKSRHFAPFLGHWTKRLRRGMGGAGWVGCADWGVIPWDFRPLWLEFFGPHSQKGITMSELSNRMIRDMQLAGLVEGSRREYLRAVRQLAAYYMVSPDQLSERKVEDYLLYVRDDLGVAKGTFAPMFAGLKFFYLNTLGYDWPLFTKKKSAGHAGSDYPTSAVTRTAAA